MLPRVLSVSGCYAAAPGRLHAELLEPAGAAVRGDQERLIEDGSPVDRGTTNRFTPINAPTGKS